MNQFKTYAYIFFNLVKISGVKIFRNIPGVAKLLGLPIYRQKSVKEWITNKRSKLEWAIRMEAPEYITLHSPTMITPVIPHSAVNGSKLILCPPKITNKRYVYWDKRTGHDARNGFCYNPILSFDETFVAKIPNGKLLGPSGVVITPDLSILEESIWVWDNWLKEDKSQTTFRLPKPVLINTPCYSLVTIYAQGYPHWILEVLPRLMGLNVLPTNLKPTLIFNDELSSFQKNSLDLMGFTNYPKIYLKDNYIQSNYLFLPSYMGISGSPHPYSCKWVRETLLKSIEVNNESQKRLYISRKFASKRRLINEEEIIPYLIDNGFDIIYTEQLSFENQVTLFSQAEIVIAPHGGGLTNLLFVPKKCKVLELLDKDYVSDYYYNLASILEIEYHYLLGTSLPVLQGLKPNSGQDDFSINKEPFLICVNNIVHS